MDPSREPGILIAQIFMEKAVFSHGPDYLHLPPGSRPEVGNVSVAVNVAEGVGGEEGFIRIEVKTDPERRPTYNVELAMLALVRLAPDNKNMTIREFMTSGAGVSLLYPFVREAFANLTLRGRFGPVWLNLINPQPIAEGLRAEADSLARRQSERSSPELTGQPDAAKGVLPAGRRRS